MALIWGLTWLPMKLAAEAVPPIFLAAEVFFALGYKPALHAAVQERAKRMRAAVPDSGLTTAS